jgi:serine/threonine protein kinase
MFHEVVKFEAKYYLILEYVSIGSLLQMLKRDSYSTFDLGFIAVHIARGMAYLHSKNIIHNDLAARNVLITTNSNKSEGSFLAKVSDFGLSFQRNGETESEYTTKEDAMFPGLKFILKLIT